MLYYDTLSLRDPMYSLVVVFTKIKSFPFLLLLFHFWTYIHIFLFTHLKAGIGPWQSIFHTHLLFLSSIYLSLFSPFLPLYFYTNISFLLCQFRKHKTTQRTLLWNFSRLCYFERSYFAARMGSGDWFKTIISLRKSKGRSKKAKGILAQEKLNASKSNNYSGKESSGLANGIKSENLVSAGVSVETIAATRIQTAFRAYKARKALRCLKGFTKLKILTDGFSVKKQASTAITYLHSWSKIQSEIRARRICMVTEDRIRRKKLESQLKLEAKLHDLEVEWCGGSDTMEEILGRIHQREEAAVKRERAMAYAFSHQWRANSSQSQLLGNYELNKANWGWSWKERWIAARPWESRVPSLPVNPMKPQQKQSGKAQKDKKTSTPKTPVAVKPPSANSNGTPPSANAKGSPPSANAKGSPPVANAKGTSKARRLSYPPTEKTVVQEVQ